MDISVVTQVLFFFCRFAVHKLFSCLVASEILNLLPSQLNIWRDSLSAISFILECFLLNLAELDVQMFLRGYILNGLVFFLLRHDIDRKHLPAHLLMIVLVT